MKHFDLFAGYGGFTIALDRAYANYRKFLSSQATKDLQEVLSQPAGGQIWTVGFSEIDKYASAVLKYRWPDIKNYGDIKKINWNSIPDFDLLTGGSPCQDLSIAGKRQGLEGERSGLFSQFMRAVCEKKPKYFIWENVKGALSSQKGWDFGTVLSEMAETGYSLWWQILNAKDFNIPQNRERIFVVGFREKSAPEVFFERESDQVNNEQDVQGNETAYCPQAGNDKHRGSYIKQQQCITHYGHKNKEPREHEISPTLKAQSHGHEPMVKQLNNPTHSNNRLYSNNGISPALNTAQGGNRQPKIPADSRIRRLTVTEAERLMDIPDGWTKYGLVTEEIICYNLDSNKDYYLNVCKQSKIQKIKGENVRWKIVKEDKKPTSVIVLCTTSDGSEAEQQNYKTKKDFPMNTETVNVNIVKKKLESSEHWECVADIIKCTTSTETRYTLKRNVPHRAGMGIFGKQMESTSTEKLWKSISGENYDITKLSTTLTAINLIIESLISTFAHAENTRLCIRGLPDLSNEGLKWEVLNLEVDTIEAMSDSTRYKLCGNGMVVAVAQKIIEELILMDTS